MSLTEEEKLEIIDRAVEKALLKLPEVVGNMMTQHAALVRMNSQFYAEHPEFANHKHIVASVIEKVDGEDTTADYKDKLARAIPEIRRRITLLTQIDMGKPPSHPNRDFTAIDVTPKSDFGAV